MRLRRVLVSAAMAAIVTIVGVSGALGLGQSFPVLQAGFSQSLFAVSSAGLGGVAFDPSAHPWVDECAFTGSPLHRFAVSSTSVVDGSSLHPETVLPSNAGCGLANHPDGTLYSNTSNGVTNLDATTGVSRRTLGPAGNALGLA